MGRSCTISEVESFKRAAIAGHTLTYFIAENSRDYDGLDRCLHTSSNPTLRAVINAVRHLANAGKVDLVQKREGHRTKYRAVWRAHPRPLDVAFRLPVLA